MKLADITDLAARNLREAYLRNSLTTLGIAVGVASLIAMLSLGVGLQQLFTQRLESSGLFDSVVVRPRPNLAGVRPTAGQRLSGDADLPQTPSRALDDAARNDLAHLPHVLQVYPDLRFTGDVRFGTDGRVTQVASLPPSSSSEDAFDGMVGHFFASPEAHQIIIQQDLASDLADTQHLQPADLIGKEIVLRYAGRQPLDTAASDASSDPGAPDDRGGESNPNESAMGFSVVSSQILLQVVGIVDAESVPSGANMGRAGAYLPVAVAESLGVVQGNDMSEVIRSAVEGGGNRYGNLTVRVERPSDVAAAEEAIKQMGFATFSLLDVTRNLQRAFAVLDLLLGIFGSLALAVASLGIVNTLVMSILERRREIGVFKALGASDRDVRQLFFVEAAVMGFFGGVAGVGLGWLIGHAIQFATNFYLQRHSIPPERIWILPPWLIGASIVFSVMISLAAGIYPATRAAKLDPVEALRYE